MTKRKGAIIPDPVNPEGTRKLVICVPDTVEWLSLVTGCMAQMTFGWYWDRSTGDLDAVRDRAKQMYFEMQEQNGLCDVIDCDEVAECIETSDAVKNALGQYINTNWIASSPGSGQIPPSVAGENIFTLSDTCDEDTAWGNALNIVQTLNRRNMDFLETVAAATNNQEMVSFFIGAIPLLETLPIDEIVVIANKVQAWLKESYEAGYDLDYEQERACEIFCLIQASPDCSLTFEQLRDFYWDKAREIAVFEDAFDTAATIISAWFNWDETLGEIVVDIMCAMQFGFLNFLNSAFGWAFTTFKLHANAGIPDDDWITVCDNCVFCYDTDGTFAALISGEWIEDEPEMRFAHATAAGGLAQFNIQFDTPVIIVSWEGQFQSLGSGTTTNTENISAYLGATLVAVLHSRVAADGGYVWQTRTSSAGVGATVDRIEFKHTHVSKQADVRGEICVEYT